MKKLLLVVFVFALAVLLIVGCGQEEKAEPKEKTVSNLGSDDVANAEYDLGMEGQTVVLENGKYESDPADRDMYMAADLLMAAYDDLDGDGNGDAAAVFGWTGGGSGYFTSLHILINENGQPLDLAQESLGDRTRINGIACNDGFVVLDMVIHGPEDPSCCPTLHVKYGYRRDGDQLHQVSADTLGVVH